MVNSRTSPSSGRARLVYPITQMRNLFRTFDGGSGQRVQICGHVECYNEEKEEPRVPVRGRSGSQHTGESVSHASGPHSICDTAILTDQGRASWTGRRKPVPELLAKRGEEMPQGRPGTKGSKQNELV